MTQWQTPPPAGWSNPPGSAPAPPPQQFRSPQPAAQQPAPNQPAPRGAIVAPTVTTIVAIMVVIGVLVWAGLTHHAHTATDLSFTLLVPC